MMEYPASRKPQESMARIVRLVLRHRNDPKLYRARLCSLPFSIDELEFILFNEVNPVFFGNVITTAGEWMGWDEEKITQLISEYLASEASGTYEFSKAQQPSGFIRRRQWFLQRANHFRDIESVAKIIRLSWEEVAHHIGELRKNSA